MTQNPHTPPKDRQEDQWIDNLILDLVHRGSMMRAGKTINAGMFPEARQKILDELAEARKGYVPEPTDSIVGHRDDETPIEKLFASFANEILAYSDRQEKFGNDILFIHSYVRRYKRRFDALLNQAVEQAKKQAASDIFNLAHQYAQEDETMVGSGNLRDYHYLNAIHKIGDFDGR